MKVEGKCHSAAEEVRYIPGTRPGTGCGGALAACRDGGEQRGRDKQDGSGVEAKDKKTNLTGGWYAWVTEDEEERTRSEEERKDGEGQEDRR